MGDVLAESTCKHCAQPIRKIAQHRLDEGLWYHFDGHRAVRECRYLMAEPVEQEAVDD
jgi:hypothetical protein